MHFEGRKMEWQENDSAMSDAGMFLPSIFLPPLFHSFQLSWMEPKLRRGVSG